jgi:hypothetical protein
MQAGRNSRSGMAIYMNVMFTATIVSAMALAAIAVVRIERRQSSTIADRMRARSNARSAIELALHGMNIGSTWRQSYTSGAESSPCALGTSAMGEVSWIVSDSDNSFTNADVALRLKGVGRAGSAIQVSGVQLGPSQTGPGELRAFGSGSSSIDVVKADQWWGQYMKVTLPADASGWRITSVEIYAKRINSNRTFQARLREPQAGGLPSSTVLDAVSLNSNDFPTDFAWCPISFSGSTWLAPTAGVCVTLETAETGAPIQLTYVSGGVSQTDSALVRGNPTWTTYETDKSLFYRVSGYYKSSTGVAPIEGSWIWDAL